MFQGDPSRHIAIIAPCYNEQDTILLFLQALERAISILPYHFTVVIVNDGSADGTAELLAGFHFLANNIALQVVHLSQNMGHQAAIYCGLQAAVHTCADRYIIMDADGEDDPATIKKMLGQDADIIHVVRGRRQEHILFRAAYAVYKVLFWLATGRHMSFGNFCIVSRQVLVHAVDNRFIHFPAFLSNAPFYRQYIVADKQARLSGSSKMSITDHLLHAARSFAELRRSRHTSSHRLSIIADDPAAKAI